MNKQSKKTESGAKQIVRFNKKSSIIFLSVVAVLLILAVVFGFVSVQFKTVDYHAYIPAIDLGLDLNGGVYAVYQADKPENISQEEYESSLDGTARRLQDMLFDKGYTEALVSVTKDNGQIRVEVPTSEQNSDEIFELIGEPQTLEFFATDAQGNKTNPNAKPYVTGKNVISATVAANTDPNTQGDYVIALRFDNKGAKAFEKATSENTGKNLGIFLGGELLMAPTVNSTISNGEAIITGNYVGAEGYNQAYNLAVQIQSGALPLELEFVESDVISAQLGETSIRDGLIAGGIGLILIIAFLIWRYRMLGVAASVSLLFFTVTYLFFLSIFPWVQLTLPGIAGILLSIGMAVDANIIIFERIKEERARNLNLNDSVAIGFRKSYSAILDGNVTTIIGAVVLILLATATIKGFAITLLIGIIISLFSSLIFTRFVLKAIMAFNNSSDKLYATEADGVDYKIVDKEKENKAETEGMKA